MTPNSRLSAAKLEAAAQAERVARVMGFPVEIDPLDALTQCIHLTAGEVEYCTQQITRLAESEALISFREQQESSEVSYVKTSTDTQLHVWIRARQDATDRLARYSKMAIDAGVSERQVANAERLGGLVGELQTGYPESPYSQPPLRRILWSARSIPLARPCKAFDEGRGVAPEHPVLKPTAKPAGAGLAVRVGQSDSSQSR